MEWAGRDATKGFDDFGHSGDAKKLLKQFKIGELVEVIFAFSQKYNYGDNNSNTLLILVFRRIEDLSVTTMETQKQIKVFLLM